METGAWGISPPKCGHSHVLIILFIKRCQQVVCQQALVWALDEAKLVVATHTSSPSLSRSVIASGVPGSRVSSRWGRVSCPTRWYLDFCDDHLSQHPDNRVPGPVWALDEAATSSRSGRRLTCWRLSRAFKGTLTTNWQPVSGAAAKFVTEGVNLTLRLTLI